MPKEIAFTVELPLKAAYAGLMCLCDNCPDNCHSERSEESRSENKGTARFLVAFGSSERQKSEVLTQSLMPVAAIGSIVQH